MENNQNLDETINSENNKKPSKFKTFVKLFCIFFILSNLFFYLSERRKYINDIYPQARKYFIINDMIFTYRYILNTFVEVDNPIMQPLNKLQKYFYDKGIKYIPQNDAERAFWNYKFNLYPYTRKTYMPKAFSKNNFVPSEIHTQILDDVYQTIVDLYRYEFKDTNFKNEKFKVVPLLADQFQAYLYLYAGTSNRLAKELSKKALQEKEVINKISNLLEILVKYNEMIHKDEKLQIEISNTSDSILRCLYYSIHRLSADLIQADILKQNINCSANYVEIYLNNFEFAYSGEKPFFANKKYSSIKPITDIIFCNNHITKTISYHLKQTCNIAIAPQCYPDEKFIDENIINEKIHIYF